MKREQLQTIVESYINGNRRQMVEQIDEYGLYDFWADLRDYFSELAEKVEFRTFADMTICYFRIKNR
jgi:hypothetical protein